MKYRVITFQSKEVVDNILCDGVHYADISLAREGSICQEDIDACGGKTPVWVFQHPALMFDTVGVKQFSHMLQTFRQEMSISSLEGLYMIDLFLDEQPPVGKAHNGTSMACVIPQITMDSVNGIYLCRETNDYFYSLDVYKLFSEDCLFKSSIAFNKELYLMDTMPTLTLSLFPSTESYSNIRNVYRAYCTSLIRDLDVNVSVEKVLELIPNRVYRLATFTSIVRAIINFMISDKSNTDLAVYAHNWLSYDYYLIFSDCIMGRSKEEITEDCIDFVCEVINCCLTEITQHPMLDDNCLEAAKYLPKDDTSCYATIYSDDTIVITGCAHPFIFGLTIINIYKNNKFRETLKLRV